MMTCLALVCSYYLKAIKAKAKIKLYLYFTIVIHSIVDILVKSLNYRCYAATDGLLVTVCLG